MLTVVVLVILVFSKGDTTLSSFRNSTQDSVGSVTNDKVGEPCIMETLSAIRSQATETNIYLQEIRKTLDVYKERMDAFEDKLKLLNIYEDKLKLLDMVDDRLDDLSTALKVNTDKTKEKIDENEGIISNVQAVVEDVKAVVEDVKAVVEANGVMTATIKTRQETMLSEVRLISLYKMTNQTSLWSSGHISDLAVDGQFVFSMWDPSSPQRAITHTARGNQKLWIDLGAQFRIYRIVVWNARHCCQERFIGTQIYADERLLGVASTVADTYEYKVSEKDPVYARSVILHQILDQWLHVSEVQVWGTGPFAEDDRFN